MLINGVKNSLAKFYLVTMLDKTGRSAMTAVVITALLLFSEDDVPEVVKTPPFTGFKPRIHTKCCKV
jgi:hypothetical protein